MLGVEDPAADTWSERLIRAQRLVAIVRLDNLDRAPELARALLAGGIAIQEFTLTNPHALRAISQVREQLSEFSNQLALLGVGSVRSVEQAQSAISAGAQFVVTPTLNIEVIEYCTTRAIPIMPGAMTPTEILTAWEAGATAVKVFPARALGPGYIKDVLAPLPELRLMPTGGVDLANLQQYFDAGAFAVGVGGNLLNRKAIDAGDWPSVTAIAKEYSRAASAQNI
jgi:2-dehydro-3-deoxyphosphogluconate aldolase/(4S)-4-hydroxy-2-oxoglutarate aldolase